MFNWAFEMRKGVKQMSNSASSDTSLSASSAPAPSAARSGTRSAASAASAAPAPASASAESAASDRFTCLFHHRHIFHCVFNETGQIFSSGRDVVFIQDTTTYYKYAFFKSTATSNTIGFKDLWFPWYGLTQTNSPHGSHNFGIHYTKHSDIGSHLEHDKTNEILMTCHEHENFKGYFNTYIELQISAALCNTETNVTCKDHIIELYNHVLYHDDINKIRLPTVTPLDVPNTDFINNFFIKNEIFGNYSNTSKQNRTSYYTNIIYNNQPVTDGYYKKYSKQINVNDTEDMYEYIYSKNENDNYIFMGKFVSVKVVDVGLVVTYKNNENVDVETRDECFSIPLHNADPVASAPAPAPAAKLASTGKGNTFWSRFSL